MPDIDLRGKDYLTQEEAAHYCGLSKRQFQIVAPGYGIRAASFGGKLLYRRTDLQRAIESAWQPSDALRAHGCSIGAKRASGGAKC